MGDSFNFCPHYCGDDVDRHCRPDDGHHHDDRLVDRNQRPNHCSMVAAVDDNVPIRVHDDGAFLLRPFYAIGQSARARVI